MLGKGAFKAVKSVMGPSTTGFAANKARVAANTGRKMAAAHPKAVAAGGLVGGGGAYGTYSMGNRSSAVNSAIGHGSSYGNSPMRQPGMAVNPSTGLPMSSGY